MLDNGHFRPVNWLLSKPWRWHYRTLYRTFRNEQRHPRSGRLYEPSHGRLRSAWLALSFPHEHCDRELDAR
jgi:hypothetical protein